MPGGVSTHAHTACTSSTAVWLRQYWKLAAPLPLYNPGLAFSGGLSSRIRFSYLKKVRRRWSSDSSEKAACRGHRPRDFELLRRAAEPSMHEHGSTWRACTPLPWQLSPSNLVCVWRRLLSWLGPADGGCAAQTQQGCKRQLPAYKPSLFCLL